MSAPLGPWVPTHRTPPAGALTWTQPAAGAPDAPPLEAGLPVQLIRAQGDWAEVRCADGLLVWVDGRNLLPLVVAGVPPAGPPADPLLSGPPPVPAALTSTGAGFRRRPSIPVLVGAGALVAVAAVVITVVLVTRGGEDGGVPAGPAVALRAPEGWTASADGLTVAAAAEDLGAAQARGPRVTATVNGGPADPAEEFARAAGIGYTLEREPEEIMVDGHRAVAVTLRWTWQQIGADGQPNPVDYLVRYIGAASSAGDSVLLEFSAPADQWDGLALTFEQIPDLG